MCGGIVGEILRDTCRSYNFSSESWTENINQTMLNKRDGSAATVSKKHGLIITGGKDGTHYLTSVEKFDGNSFKELDEMLEARQDHCQVQVFNSFPSNKINYSFREKYSTIPRSTTTSSW